MQRRTLTMTACALTLIGVMTVIAKSGPSPSGTTQGARMPAPVVSRDVASEVGLAPTAPASKTDAGGRVPSPASHSVPGTEIVVDPSEAKGVSVVSSAGKLAHIYSQSTVMVLDTTTGVRTPVARSEPDHYMYGIGWSLSAGAIAFGENTCTPGVVCEPAGGAVRVVDLNTGEIRTVASIPSVNILSVAWSPDGRRIAFSTMGAFAPLWGAPTTGAVVHVVNADGSGERPVAEGNDPSWAPDSKHLVYSTNYATIAVVDVDAPAPRVISPAEATGGWPAWSPDGALIAFVANTVGSDTPAIWIVGADGQNARPLANSATGDPPTWSADGTQLAFENTGLHVIDASGTQRRTIADEEAYFPAWSPDGSLIAYEVWGEARLVAPDGTGDRHLASGVDAGSLVWPR